MATEPKVPGDPVAFIKKCLHERHIYWTYHVNMRLAGRHITRSEILEEIDGYEIVESYPDDKYLPSYLLLGKAAGVNFHALFAVDVEGDNVRIVTAYRPNPNEWETDMRTRRRIP